jgi:hypothetical protein
VTRSRSQVGPWSIKVDHSIRVECLILATRVIDKGSYDDIILEGKSHEDIHDDSIESTL